MDLGLDGKTAVVVGASGDVGLAVSQALAAEGCSLHLAGRDEAALAGIASVLNEAHGVEVEVHASDLTNRVEIDVLSLDCEDADILVACPGAAPETGVDDSLGRDWDFKVIGVGDILREMASTMAEREAPGTLVVVGVPMAGAEAAAANAALASLVEGLAPGYADKGIRLAAILPGAPPCDVKSLGQTAAFLASDRSGATSPILLVLGNGGT